MDKRHAFSRPSAAFAFLLLLAGCNGGGGGGGAPSGNQPPVVKVDAPEGEVMELSTVTLSAKGSEDPDGDELTFKWKQVSGPEVTLVENDTTSINFRLPKVRNTETVNYVFELTVSDGENEVVETVEFSPSVYEANGVLFSAVQDAPNVEKLYFDHPAFDEPLVIDAVNATEGQHVEYGSILVTPNHRYAIFERGVWEGDDVSRRVLRAALDGSGATDITGVADAEYPDVYSPLKFSPDGQWVAFMGTLDKDVIELYAVPINSTDGSDRITLSGEITAVDVDGLVAGDVSSDFLWSPDSREILFSGDLRTDRHYEIFVTNLETGGRRVISREPSEDNAGAFNYANPDYGPYNWSPDGEYVAMMQESVDNDLAIDVVRADGTGRVTVADNLARDVDSIGKIAMSWSSQGALAFKGNTTPPGEGFARELYIYTPGTPNPGPFAVAGTSAIDDEGPNGLPDAQIHRFRWSPDGGHLAFWTRRTNPLRVANFVVSEDATSDAASVRIDEGNDAATGSINGWLHDSSGILLIRKLPDGPPHLYLNTLDGTPLRQLSAGIDTNAFGVSESLVSGDSKLLAYSVYPSSMRLVSEIHLVSLQGDTEPRTISGPITASDGNDNNGMIDGDANLEAFSPDGGFLLFSGDLETDDLDELYVVPVDSADGSDRRRITDLLDEDSDENGEPDGYSTFAKWVGPDPD